MVEGLIVTGTMELLNMKSLDDIPGSDFIKEDCWLSSNSDRKEILSALAVKFLDRYVRLSYNNNDIDDDCEEDPVTEYTVQLLRIGLFYLEYRDAIQEGDGVRVLRCWKYLLLVFFNTNRKNYLKEALNLLCQHDHILTERQSLQLLYSRFVNTQGGKGRNIPADLHMEHLNKVCKECVRDLGPNKTTESIQQVSKCIGPIDSVMTAFDTENGVHSRSGDHKKASNTDDVKTISNDLVQYKVFISQNRKAHHSFKRPKNLFTNEKKKKLLNYMK